MSSLVVTGVATSRAATESGRKPSCCCLHPNGRSLFFATGGAIDEVDSRDGSLLCRLLTDLQGGCVRESARLHQRERERERARAR